MMDYTGGTPLSASCGGMSHHSAFINVNRTTGHVTCFRCGIYLRWYRYIRASVYSQWWLIRWGSVVPGINRRKLIHFSTASDCINVSIFLRTDVAEGRDSLAASTPYILPHQISPLISALMANLNNITTRLKRIEAGTVFSDWSQLSDMF